MNRYWKHTLIIVAAIVAVGSLAIGGVLAVDVIQAQTTVSMKSKASDGASAVAAKVDTSSAWSNASARLLSLNTNASEKFYVKADGTVISQNYYGTPDGTAGGYYGGSTSNGVLINSGGLSAAIYNGHFGPYTDLFANCGTSSKRWAEVYSRHFVSSQAAVPTISCGTGAGTSPTCNNPSGSDTAMLVTITTGSGPSGSNADVATITFNTAWAAAPTCIMEPAEANSQALAVAATPTIYAANTSTSVFKISAGTSALGATTTYKWQVLCIQ